ncbi:YHS domain-containing protein [Tenacibaculum lutimaris]|uniref:YHS domain-containing protein n=1 Tax=Tenacibaculum lutimaris TaxID=285258 RepID=A0A420E4Q4_9FLAO|nr:YHS domain-containing (seleno)protein [Tenacibaculum lutimaris]RKF05115.1 YHS domain-containing protein [Tenacibaculum lutimaris]
MKNTITLLLLIISSALFSQKTEYYLKKGYIAEGYDVVSYFNKKPLEGNKKYQSIYDGVKFKFSSEKNLALFKENPTKYIPQYGGYCAYAIGKTGEKVSINPKTFEIRDGKLYLFYNSWGTNTLKLWLKENPEQLKKQADINWKKRIRR